MPKQTGKGFPIYLFPTSTRRIVSYTPLCFYLLRGTLQRYVGTPCYDCLSSFSLREVVRHWRLQTTLWYCLKNVKRAVVLCFAYLIFLEESRWKQASFFQNALFDFFVRMHHKKVRKKEWFDPCSPRIILLDLNPHLLRFDDQCAYIRNAFQFIHLSEANLVFAHYLFHIFQLLA